MDEIILSRVLLTDFCDLLHDEIQGFEDGESFCIGSSTGVGAFRLVIVIPDAFVIIVHLGLLSKLFFQGCLIAPEVMLAAVMREVCVEVSPGATGTIILGSTCSNVMVMVHMLSICRLSCTRYQVAMEIVQVC